MTAFPDIGARSMTMARVDGNAGIALFPFHGQHRRMGRTAEAALLLTMKRLALAVLTVSFGVPSLALSQDIADYPNRPIRVIVPFGPGAGVDTAARITAEAAEKYLNQR